MGYATYASPRGTAIGEIVFAFFYQYYQFSFSSDIRTGEVRLIVESRVFITFILHYSPLVI